MEENVPFKPMSHVNDGRRRHFQANGFNTIGQAFHNY